MESIKKFEEYELDYENEMSEEYAKLILSTYIDKKNDESLESVYADIIRDDETAVEHEYIIKNNLQDYLYNLYSEAKNIRKIIDIDSGKYNM